jgi:hypothetical protein
MKVYLYIALAFLTLGLAYKGASTFEGWKESLVAQGRQEVTDATNKATAQRQAQQAAENAKQLAQRQADAAKETAAKQAVDKAFAEQQAEISRLKGQLNAGVKRADGSVDCVVPADLTKRQNKLLVPMKSPRKPVSQAIAPLK